MGVALGHPAPEGLGPVIASGGVQFHDSLEVDLVPIDSVTPHPDNYNNGSIEDIMESIEVNGMYRPLYVQKQTGYIFAGNHTWYACKQLGAEVVPVKYIDADDLTILTMLVGDNEIARKALPDTNALLQILETLDSQATLLGSGKKPHDLEVLRNLAKIPVDYDEFAQWPTLMFQVPPHVKRGYMRMTDGAGDDRERFELLLRLAGWDGKG